MDDRIFRKKALDRISSPEELNQYVKAAPISVWLLMSAIIVFLIGICGWGILGRIDTVVNGVVYVKDGKAQAYVREEDGSSLKKGMTVTADGIKYAITSIGESPIHLTEDSKDLGFLISYLDKDDVDEWVYEVNLGDAGNGQPEDGAYSASILVESIKPFSFITN